MTLERIIQIGLCLVVGAGLIGYFISAQKVAQDTYQLESAESKPEPPPCTDNTEFRDDARRIIHDGLNEALHNQVERLFEVWMKDPADQPRRARNGILNALRAYLHARTQVEMWDIPPCKTN